MARMKSRLAAADWIVAGFRALASDGPQALKAEPLARRLGTTKGSFYWHFKDVPDFQKQMVGQWEQQNLNQLSDALTDVSDPIERLQTICAHPANETREAQLEPAFRSWAQQYPDAAQALKTVDDLRLTAIEATLMELGLSNPQVARIVYGAHLGLRSLPENQNHPDDDAMSTLLAAVLALRDA